MKTRTDSFFALVVDDNEINRMICEDLLLELGVSSILAESGAQALAAIENKEFDIIFIDHVMPEMDGIELCRRIRAMGGRLTEIPVVVLTGNDVERYKSMYISAGMDGWLTKPVGYGEMAKILNERLGISITPPKQKKEPSYDRRLLRAFVAQAREKLPLMEQFIKDGDLNGYSIEVHSFKTSLTNVGEPKVSEMARELERQSDAGNLQFVIDNNSAFAEAVRACSDKAADLIEKECLDTVRPVGDIQQLFEKLEKTKELMDDFEASEAADIVRGLTEHTYGSYDSQIEELDALFDSYSFERIGDLLSGLMLSVIYTKGE